MRGQLSRLSVGILLGVLALSIIGCEFGCEQAAKKDGVAPKKKAAESAAKPPASPASATDSRAPSQPPLPVKIPPEEAKKLTAELDAAIREWVKALDSGSAEGVTRLSPDADLLRTILTSGHFNLLSGTMVPKNAQVVEELVKVARGENVKLLSLTVEAPTMAQKGRSIFKENLPLVSIAALKLEIGKYPVELHLRQAVRYKERWHVIDFGLVH